MRIILLWFTDQEEREYAMRCFREGKKDVMVATDVASKGLDFPDIQHVINFDMPEDIENYGKKAHHIWRMQIFFFLTFEQKHFCKWGVSLSKWHYLPFSRNGFHFVQNILKFLRLVAMRCSVLHFICNSMKGDKLLRLRQFHRHCLRNTKKKCYKHCINHSASVLSQLNGS